MGNTTDKIKKGIKDGASAVKRGAEKGTNAAGRGVDKAKGAASRGAEKVRDKTDRAAEKRTSDSFEKNRHSICLGIEPSQGGMSLSRTCTGLPFFCKPMAQIPWAIACKRRRFDRDNPALLTQ